MGNALDMVRIGFVCSLKNTKIPFYLSEFIKTVSKDKNAEFVCFSMSDVNFNLMTVSGTIVNSDGIFEQETNLPKCIFNFVSHTKLDNIKAMRRLRTLEGYKVVNPINRFNQTVIYDIIRSFPQSDQFLLPFSSLTKEKVLQQFNESGILYVLPERSASVGNSAMVKRASEGDVILSAGKSNFYCCESELYDSLLKMTMGKKYISMQGVDLLQRNGLPFEAGVYVQKNQKGQWVPTFALAKNNMFSCGSIYQDGSDDLNYALFETAPKKADEISSSINNLAVTICSYLDYYILNMASAMLDFVISDNGSPYLIMFGGCEQRFNAPNADIERLYYYNIFRYMLYVSGENYYISDGE